MAERPLAEATRRTFDRCIRTCLRSWSERNLEPLGADRMGFRARIIEISRRHGPAIAANCLRMFRAVYTDHRKANLELPECPSIVVDPPTPRQRDWALTGEDLQRWREALRRRRPLRRV